MTATVSKMRERHMILHREIDALYGKHKPGLMDFDLFDAMYNEPVRAYHNFDHLNQMYKVHENLTALSDLNAENMVDVELFIWWHDIIYQPGRKNNEYLSAQLFAACTPDTMHQIDMVAAILASVHNGRASNAEPWIQYCLDLDLSAMIDTKTYTENGEKIREEFKHIPMIEFWKGRKTFLLSLLKHDKIFYNPYDLSFYKDGEWLVRANIENEVNTLTKKGF